MTPAASSTTDPAHSPSPDDLVEVGAYRTAAEGFAHGLVVLATGRPYWLVPEESHHRLLIAPEGFAHVRAQLARYDRESLGWPPAPLTDRAAARADFVTPLLWMMVVLAAFWAQSRWPALTAAGALDARAVFTEGEWWRAATALFLHADAEHVLSNALSGLFVFSALLSTIGRARGWLLITLASIGANLLSAAVHYPAAYRSIGASTAIFAALGLLTGRALRVVWQDARPLRWQALFLPLASGLTVLALYGSGQQPVDVLAHVAGFVVGLGLGAASGVTGRKRLDLQAGSTQPAVSRAD